MLEKEFRYYMEHEQEFLRLYLNKYVVIKNDELLGVYDTEIEAYEQTRRDHDLGTFLIQHVKPGSTIQTFHSRVRVA